MQIAQSHLEQNNGGVGKVDIQDVAVWRGVSRDGRSCCRRYGTDSPKRKASESQASVNCKIAEDAEDLQKMNSNLEADQHVTNVAAPDFQKQRTPAP